MDLVANIKAKRAQTHRKSAFKRTLFDRIGSIIGVYGLEDTFLKQLDAAAMEQPGRDLLRQPLMLPPKAPLEMPLFVLLHSRAYDLAGSIIRKIDCPYLDFVTAPEEILVCRRLYGLNPHIPADRLQKCHFGTLLMGERVRRRIKELSRQMDVLRTLYEPPEDKTRRRLDALAKQLAYLRVLAGVIEKSNSDLPQRVFPVGSPTAGWNFSGKPETGTEKP